MCILSGLAGFFFFLMVIVGSLFPTWLSLVKAKSVV